MSSILPIVFFVIAATAILLIISFKKKSDEEPEVIKENELTSRFSIGQYVEGLPGENKPLPIVSCGITENDFVFCKGSAGAEIGRIARNSLTKINISKQGDKICFIEINWSDSAMVKQRAIFRFEDKKRAEAMASETAQELKKWQIET